MKRQNVLNKKKKKKGFTLIELIIVMAIMAVLAVVAIPKYSEFRETANKKHDVATAKTIANAASGLVADEKISTNISPAITIDGNGDADTPQKKIADMLQNIPTGKTKDHTGNFKVTVVDGTVHVWLPSPAAADGSAGADAEVYPKTHDDFK